MPPWLIPPELKRRFRRTVIPGTGDRAVVRTDIFKLAVTDKVNRLPFFVFPVSFEDTGSGVFAAAFSAVALGFGPLRAATAQRLALAVVTCGLAALLVDVYLY